MRKESIYQLNNLELIKVLDSVPDDKALDIEDASNFASAMRLERGSFRVSFRFLYSLYRMWSRKPVSRTSFGKFLKNHFKRSRNRYDVYYWLNRKEPKRF